MLKIKKLSVMALLTSAVVSQAVLADKQFDDEVSYTFGYLMGQQFKGISEDHKDVVNYNQEKVLAGIKDVLANKSTLTDEKAKETLQKLADKVHSAQTAKTKAENEKFTAEFAKKTNVKKTESGLLYRIEKTGEGQNIQATDLVKVHYTGKLANGEVFDSSVQRGQPAEFKLNQVIPGWTEGLQLIKKDGKIELVIPANLAYGESGSGPIPANATLYFEVEVLDVTPEK
ncbi:FKBP-type peptidyl-prolyl cis-trans isomerase [Haemophilus haemoglobinophilus]|nr:FKBP-type peptidyl-prolyl cis-trans isomerase [Canicola haemoglobinophilus]